MGNMRQKSSVECKTEVVSLATNVPYLIRTAPNKTSKVCLLAAQHAEMMRLLFWQGVYDSTVRTYRVHVRRLRRYIIIGNSNATFNGLISLDLKVALLHHVKQHCAQIK